MKGVAACYWFITNKRLSVQHLLVKSYARQLSFSSYLEATGLSIMELLENDDIIKFWFSCVPKPAELCHVIGYVSISEISKAPQKSTYHHKVLKCRQIIFMAPHVIASPSSTEECAVHILMKKEFYDKGHIIELLEKLKLRFTYSNTVAVSVYEACLCYTLTARVSPLWNQVGKYLIEGRDFLTNSSTMNGVKIEVVIRDGEMFLLVWTVRVKLPSLHLEHLEVPGSVTEKLEFQETASLTWGINFAQVLPNLSKCCIVRVSKSLSNHWLYKSYKEMRRHWKNMYGYRLPEDPSNLLFYGVKFQSPSSTEFTYPSVCLKPHGLVFFRNTEQKAILRSFLPDLMTKMPTICGSKFGAEPKIGVAVPKLQFSNQLLEHPNLVLFDPDILTKDHQDVTSQPLELTPALHEKEDVSEITPTPLYSQRESMSTDSQPVYLPVTLPSNTAFERNTLKPKYVPVFKPNTPPFTFTQAKREVVQQRSSVVNHSTGFVERGIKYGLYEHAMSPQTPATSSKSTPLKVKLVQCEMSKPHFLSEVPLSGMCSLLDSNKMKKPRSRPQIQTGIDVEALARGHDLSRVNTATLVNWLRKKNVPCKVKDRKADLVTKVMDYFKLEEQ